MMKTRFNILFSLVALAMLGGVGIAAAAPAVSTGTQDGDNSSYSYGPLGPGNALYGIRIAFENLDESFTFNQSEKLEKQVSHAGIRLAEVQNGLRDNVMGAADIALEQYWLKMNQTEAALEPMSLNGTGDLQGVNDTGLRHAQEMIARHQQVLEDLLQSHPDNKGLERAYNNSVELEQKFANKIENHQKVRQQERENLTDVSSGNMTTVMDKNQSWNRGPGNNSWELPSDMNQTQGLGTMNRNGHDTNLTVQDQRQKQGNSTQENLIPGQSEKQQGSNGKNTGNAGTTQNGNTNNNQNSITNNANRNNTIVNQPGNTNNQNAGKGTSGASNKVNTGDTRSSGR
ncbi:DUF5667 domain-containing protein [Methanoregula sp.]|uniref:DUF5667 domain-containing protein n=1 Tax=Methanoregula sp. TaxID=2052170 RepID=UPI00237389C8|nr:DUF5667 domain-containing protein [Methanoregula sp.]MDD1686602.1 DUF5667 domain-containing protein [Methanoregula sp.]